MAGASGLSIRYSAEGEALETAGGIAKALPLLGDAPFLVVNADIFTGVDYAALLSRRPVASGECAGPSGPGGQSRAQPARRFQPGVRSSSAMTGRERLTFSGIGVYDPALFSGVQAGARAALAPLLRTAMREGRISGERFGGLWIDVGTPQRLAEVDA